MPGGVEIESRERSICRRSPEETRFRRRVEGSGTEDRHDRYSDRGAMVHLRRCKGLAAYAPSATTRDAGIAQEEVRSGVKHHDKTLMLPIGSSLDPSVREGKRIKQFDLRAVHY